MGKNSKYHQSYSLGNRVPVSNLSYRDNKRRACWKDAGLLNEGGSEIKTAVLYCMQMQHVTQRGDGIQIWCAPKESQRTKKPYFRHAHDLTALSTDFRLVIKPLYIAASINREITPHQ